MGFKNRIIKWILLSGMMFSPLLYAADYQAIVSMQPKSGEFKSITDALNAAPKNKKPYTIFIKTGTYTERLVIKRQNVTLIGENQKNTVIEFDLPAGKLDEQGKKYGTTNSAIVQIKADNFTAENLTIRNSFDYPANQLLSNDDPTKIKDTQAVALLINDNVDSARFRHVTLEGYQDTLYIKNGSRSYFTDSTITGHVDFIFGGGTAIFEYCQIVARNRTDAPSVYGYITAPSTPLSQQYGLIFINNKLTKEAGVPAKSFALGRPWHPTTQFSDGKYADPNAIGQAVFINNDIEDHIYGWDKMSGKDINGDKIWFLPEDSRFFEYANTGIGGKRNHQHYLLNHQDAETFSVVNIFKDWDATLLKR